MKVDVYFFGMGANTPKRDRTWKLKKSIEVTIDGVIDLSPLGLLGLAETHTDLTKEPMVKISIPSRQYEIIMIRRGTDWDVYNYMVSIL